MEDGASLAGGERHQPPEEKKRLCTHISDCRGVLPPPLPPNCCGDHQWKEQQSLCAQPEKSGIPDKSCQSPDPGVFI